MELQHLNVKLYAERPEGLNLGKFTPIFQRWIQDQVCKDELLLDVADYLHVPAGPGIVLIGHEADYSMDETDHRLGLRYNRKTGLGGNNGTRIQQALSATFRAASLLEQEPMLEGKLKFNREAFDLSVNDRALAPNTPQTFEALKPELQAGLTSYFGAGTFSFSHLSDPRTRFGVVVKLNKSR